jgi:hypothetical protein
LGQRLIKQITVVGDKLIDMGVVGDDKVILKIIPTKSSFVKAAAFGAIGVAIASFRDEAKKKKMKKDLEEGKLIIINQEVDKQLFELTDKYHWDITIG